VVSYPEQVENSLQQAAASAWQRYLEDEVKASDEDAPYA
jgi:hypothetical protein